MTEYKDKVEELYKKKVLELNEIKKAQATENTPLSEDYTSDEKPEDDFLVYGSDRTKRQKIMLNFIMLGNKTLNIPYNQIMLFQTLENRLITIHLQLGTIDITGVNIDLIAARLRLGFLSYIREGGKEKPATTPDGVCVYTITHNLTGIP